MEITLEEVNQLLHIGPNVKARDVLDVLPRETLHNALAFIVARLEQ